MSIVVAHVCQSTRPEEGGAPVVASELVKAQRRLGAEAYLVCLYSGPKCDADVTSITCEIPRRSRWTRGVLKLRRVIRTLTPDIIHYHDGLLWPRMATIGLSIPTVTHGHLGAPTGALWNSANITWWATRLTSTRVIAISDWVADSWARKGFARERIGIIENGVDANKFARPSAAAIQQLRTSLKIPTGKTTLLWVGRLASQMKGIDRLCSLLERLDSRFHVEIVGEGPARNLIQDLTRNKQLRCSISLAGTARNPAPYFAVADAFLFTSREEPFGLVLLEAAAAGLPIFALECLGGGSKLLRRLNARVFDDADQMAQELLQKPLSPRGRAEVAEISATFSWEAAARGCLSVYSAIREAI